MSGKLDDMSNPLRHLCQWTFSDLGTENKVSRLAAQIESPDLHEKELCKVREATINLDPRPKSPVSEADSAKNPLKMTSSQIQQSECNLLQKLAEERTRELESEQHQKEIAALKSELERTAIVAQEKETTLLMKLSQEEALRQEAEAKWNELKRENENTENLHKDQIKELMEDLKTTQISVNLAKLENEELMEKCQQFQEMATNSAKELFGLRETVEQERIKQRKEIQTLQNKLDTMTTLMKEKETTLMQKLAEEEAKTAKANAKFNDYKEELLRVTTERQHYLKNEVKRHKKRAEDNLMAYWEADQKLNREMKKSADLQRRKLTEERTRELESEQHQKEIAALKSELERTAIVAQEKETTLLMKLSQEEALRQEAEAKWKELNRENENTENLHKDQIKEHAEDLKTTQISVNLAKLENEELTEKFQEMATNSPEELFGLRETVEQECVKQRKEIQTLQNKLDTMTTLMKEKETTLMQKLAEEEAKTAKANAKFNDYKEEILRVTTEQQHYLRNEVKRHKKRAEDNLMAYWEADHKLTREMKKSADQQRRLDELTETLARYQQTSSPARFVDGAARDGYRDTSERSAVNHHSRAQQQRQSAYRSSNRNQRHYQS